MSKKTISFLFFLTFLTIYYFGSFSKISFGDCIGFVLDVENRIFVKDFMPLTHFLYINTAVFFSKFLHVDSVVVMRMMSVIPAALTVSFLFLLIKEFLEENWIAIAATTVFGLCFTFWRSAETVEVYTFNALFVIVFLLFSVKALKKESRLHLALAGVILGLSLWVHIQNIMLIPAYFLLLYMSKSGREKVATSLILFILIFSVMFAVNHMKGFEMKYVFTSKKGPWVQNTMDQSFFDLMTGIIRAVLYLIYNFNVFILFSVSGLIYLYKYFKREALFLFVASLFTLGFATFYAVSDNYVYFIPFYLTFAVYVASGIKKLRSSFPLRKLWLTPLLTPLFYIFSMYLISVTPQGKEFHDKKLYKGGLDYYMLPWLYHNIGCIEFTLDNGKTEDDVEAMKAASNEFIKLRRKYQPLEEIRKL